jgi:heme oxygenase
MTTTLERPGLAATLRAATSDAHERLDRRITAARPFESRERFARFVAIQYRLFVAVEPLYADPEVTARLGDIAGLSRLEATAADLADLGAGIPSGAVPADVRFPETVGWLYVVEGSNLGAAFLLREAAKLGLHEGFGARHLAGAPEGRGLAWRRFREALDGAGLSPAETEAATLGAIAAFAFVGGLVGEYLEAG